jgi:hypothetical protein
VIRMLFSFNIIKISQITCPMIIVFGLRISHMELFMIAPELIPSLLFRSLKK